MSDERMRKLERDFAKTNALNDAEALATAYVQAGLKMKAAAIALPHALEPEFEHVFRLILPKKEHLPYERIVDEVAHKTFQHSDSIELRKQYLRKRISDPQAAEILCDLAMTADKNNLEMELSCPESAPSMRTFTLRPVNAQLFCVRPNAVSRRVLMSYEDAERYCPPFRFIRPPTTELFRNGFHSIIDEDNPLFVISLNGTTSQGEILREWDEGQNQSFGFACHKSEATINLVASNSLIYTPSKGAEHPCTLLNDKQFPVILTPTRANI